MTAISNKVVAQLNLPTVSVIPINTANGPIVATQHYVSLFLPGKVVIPKILVTCANLVAPTDMLIGMDIISQGDFAVTNFRNQTCVSFRVPSAEHIDFCTQKPKPFTNPTKTVGRNDPCQCGSGKKYKKCCGK